MANHINAPRAPGDVWSGELQKRWAWVLAAGILFTLLGSLGLGMVFAVAPANARLFGMLLAGGSIAHVVQMFRAASWRNVGVQALIALLYLVAALLVFIDPVAAYISLRLVLGFFLIGIGVLRAVGGAGARPLRGWGWLLASGIIEVLLGAMVLSGWPVSGLWVIGLVISIDLLVNGVAYIALSLQLRAAERESLHA